MAKIAVLLRAQRETPWPKALGPRLCIISSLYEAIPSPVGPGGGYTWRPARRHVGGGTALVPQWLRIQLPGRGTGAILVKGT